MSATYGMQKKISQIYKHAVLTFPPPLLQVTLSAFQSGSWKSVPRPRVPDVRLRSWQLSRPHGWWRLQLAHHTFCSAAGTRSTSNMGSKGHYSMARPIILALNILPNVNILHLAIRFNFIFFTNFDKNHSKIHTKK